jgi:hypothetical protein
VVNRYKNHAGVGTGFKNHKSWLRPIPMHPSRHLGQQNNQPPWPQRETGHQTENRKSNESKCHKVEHQPTCEHTVQCPGVGRVKSGPRGNLGDQRSPRRRSITVTPATKYSNQQFNHQFIASGPGRRPWTGRKTGEQTSRGHLDYN